MRAVIEHKRFTVVHIVIKTKLFLWSSLINTIIQSFANLSTANLICLIIVCLPHKNSLLKSKGTLKSKETPI
jgi:hypothetical protein